MTRARLVAALLLASCGPESPSPSPASSPSPAAEWFVDVTAARGVDFRHRNGGGGEKQFPEIVSGGAVVLDFDVDGDLDLFFPQGAPFPGCKTEGVDFRDRLFRNERGRFVDATDAAHCSEPGYTLSATAADWDGDGDPDLLLCNFGGIRLLRNDGGLFADVTTAAGVTSHGWPQCAAFADFDQDGDLDFYVGHYVVYDPAKALWCGDR